MKNIKVVVIAALFSAFGVSLTFAHEPDMSDEMSAYVARDGIMHLIGAQRNILRNMASGKIPDNRREFVRAANALAAMFAMLPTTFEKNAMVAESRAKPEIWTNWDDFVSTANTLSAVAANIATTAGTVGLDAGKAKIGEIDCGSCHTPFRE